MALVKRIATSRIWVFCGAVHTTSALREFATLQPVELGDDDPFVLRLEH
jgi:hypothetical protein